MIAIGGQESWQWRLGMAKDPVSRKCFAIMRSSIHNNGVGAHTFPRFAYDQAIITAEGDVQCLGRNVEGGPNVIYYLGPIKSLVDDFRRVADGLKLSDKDREELFLCFRQWFRKDYRAISNMADDYKNG